MPSLDSVMSRHRLMRAPLDDSEIYASLSDLMNYCKNGACYDGQRVAVVDNNLGLIEYTIKNNIPIINLRGSEPIFNSLNFNGDTSESRGMLIYENNLSGAWEQNSVFCLQDGSLCLLSQLEIFRILDATGNKTFKFYMERTLRNTTQTEVITWNQNYNPYSDNSNNTIPNTSSGAIITEMLFITTENGWLKTNNSDIYLMPKDSISARQERDYITKIYVKAEDYYNAWKL